jgi:hypothetical protein
MTIDIQHDRTTKEIPVGIWVKNSPSTHIRLNARQLRFYRSLGLII